MAAIRIIALELGGTQSVRYQAGEDIISLVDSQGNKTTHARVASLRRQTIRSRPLRFLARQEKLKFETGNIVV